MKPHVLQLEAFGPYADPCEIAFDPLSDEGLFLIYGSTGSGKTFLLDALCFALYGEVSGERHVKGLKSDHAPSAAVPRVCLQFSCGGAFYRVERSPAYLAPKARGQGFTEKAPSAALFRLNGSESEPIATRTQEVNREVEQLVGLNASQFRQVILLPQGRFAEVLRAKADEREALLKTLFDTVLFERAGLWLEEQRRSARDAVQAQSQALEGLRRQAWQISVPFQSSSEPDGQESLPGDLGALEALLAQLDGALSLASQGVSDSTNALNDAQAHKVSLDRQAERWDRRATATARLIELEGKQDVVEAYRQKLQRAERAETLRGSLEAEASARAAWENECRRVDAQLLHCRSSRDQALACPDALVRLPLNSAPGLEALADARSALASRRTELTALARQAEAAAEAHQLSARAAGLAAEAGALLHQATAAQVQCRQRRQAAADQLQAATTAHDQLQGLEQAATTATLQAQIAVRVGQVAQQRQQALAQQQAADRELLDRNALLQQLRRRQLDGMAAHLAEGLSVGVPCPVCGALEHPSPAMASEQPVADHAIETAERHQAEASAAARLATEALVRADTALRTLQEQVGPAPLHPQRAATAAAQATDALARARALAAQRPLHHQELQAHERDLQTLQEQIDRARTDQALHGSAAAEARQRALSLEAEIHACLGEAVHPQVALESLLPLESALRDLASAVEQVATRWSQLEQASRRLAEELAASPFDALTSARDALKPEPWRRDLEERIAAYTHALIANRAVLAEADLLDLPELRPDTAAAHERVLELDAARSRALDHHSQVRVARDQLQRLLQSYGKEQAVLQQLEARWQLLQGVADRCTGRAAPYISLQRWVLSAYLAEICRYANQRLELMTSQCGARPACSRRLHRRRA